MSTLKVLIRWWFPVVLLLLLPFKDAWAAGTPAGTVISNHATMQYKDANGNTLPHIQSNTVTTIVSQVAGVDVSPASSNKNVSAGNSVVFSVMVTNMGNGADTFSLSLTPPAAGWTDSLFADTNSNGILDPGENAPGNVVSAVTLAADETKYLLLIEHAPSGAANGVTETITLTATSQFNTGVSDSGAYTSTVQTAVLSIVKIATPTNPKPGEVVTYALNGTNSGSTTAYGVVVTDVLPLGVTYVPGSMRYAAVAGSTYDTATPLTDANDADPANFGITAANTVTVNWGNSPAGQQGTIYFRVAVNDGVASGTHIDNVASIVYSTTSGGPLLPALSSTTATITVAAKAAFTLSPMALSHTGDSGDSVKYAFSITNNGNATDRFDGTPSSTLGFASIVWLDANNDGIIGNDGDYILTDADGDGKVETPYLLPGAVAHLIKVVIVTPGTPDLSVDVTSVIIASENDPTVSATLTLTTTVNAPVVSMTKSVSPTGAQPPGTVLTYTLTITNTGHGIARSLLIGDLVPNNTTYQPGTITVNGSARTDAADGDNASLQTGTIVVDIPTMGPGGTATITFKVMIN